MNMNIERIVGLLYGMKAEKRRYWFVRMKMDAAKQTFASIAARHQMTTWTLAKAVTGGAAWSPRITRALQSDLKTDLSSFLTEKERQKLAAE